MKSKPLPENSMDLKLVAPSAEAAASRAAFAFWARARTGHSAATARLMSTLFLIISPLVAASYIDKKAEPMKKATVAAVYDRRHDAALSALVERRCSKWQFQ